MLLLSIETSCDETAVSVIEAEGTLEQCRFTIHGNALYSQAKLHEQYGGVYPTLAKREHAKNLVPLLIRALKEAGLYESVEGEASPAQTSFCKELFSHEPELLASVLREIPRIQTPKFNAIAVTQGPGLEPALWVGINFARALSFLWNAPIVPVNHMEGHLVASTVRTENAGHTYTLTHLKFPVLGLLISGGHTELVYAEAWGSYTCIGATRDDSVGEAFDKVARLLDLPYPGGPEVSRLAEKGRMALLKHEVVAYSPARKALPRPMLHSNDLDFSFSGLKTAVKYLVRDIPVMTEEIRNRICAEFEEAVVEVFIAKTRRALVDHPAHTFLIGGGVSANSYIRTRIAEFVKERHDALELCLPAQGLTTDNAIMIGMAGYMRHVRGVHTLRAEEELPAMGNMLLS